MPYMEIWCEICGSKFIREVWDIKTTGNYCSKRCLGKRNFKTGKTRNKAGYIMVYKPKHPTKKGAYVMEHRLVMEKHLGRYLREDEVVHHINGKVDDNRIENLEIMDSGEHTSLELNRGYTSGKSNRGFKKGNKINLGRSGEKHWKFIKIDKDEFIKIYNELESGREVAKYFRVSSSVVWDRAKEWGINRITNKEKGLNHSSASR